MSYSLNDNFYIDTETSTARLQGNLDLQNSIRFNKTDTEEGIVIQANVIKERLVESSYIPNEIGTQFNTRLINNYTNSNTLQLQLIDIHLSDNKAQLILQLQNTNINDTLILPLLGNNYISIPPSHQLCYKLDTSFHNYESAYSYIPYIGTTYQHRTYFQENNSDYFIGFAYGSNTYLRETTSQQLLINGPTGYFTKRTLQNGIQNSMYLKANESYFTDGILHTSNEIISCIYRNLNNPSLKWINIQETPIYDPQITIPITQNDYWILLFAHRVDTPSQYSFVKSIRTLGNTSIPHYPRILNTTNGFILYFLIRTDPLTPIVLYSLTYVNGSYQYIEDPNIRIPGTSLSDSYQYVIISFDNYGVYQWHTRIVLKNLNRFITDPIYAIHHENNEFTVSILNQTSTDVIIYNSDKSTSILTNLPNVFIRFTENGNYRWSTKYSGLPSIPSHRSLITPYTSNTFFTNLLYNTTLGSTIQLYNSDGTTFNTINIDDATYINSLVYYDNNGRVKHENRSMYFYSISSNELLQSWIASQSNKDQIYYSQHNRSIDQNATVNYTDAFLNSFNSFIYANSIHLNYFDLITESTGQKQLSFGNNIRVLNFEATDLNIRGNLSLEDDLSLKQLTLSSNLLLGLESKVGIGTMFPRTTMDIYGDTLVNGKIGIGTDVLESRFNVTTVNENPMSINNQVIQYFPKTGFYTNGYIKNGSFISSIDSSNDIVEYPAPPGSTYGGNSLYLSSSDYAAFAARDKAFDKNFNNSWITELSKYDSATGVPSGTAGSTIGDGNTVNGEWIQLYNTRKLQLSSYAMNTYETLVYPLIGSGYGSPVSRPGSWIIAGSLNGSTWTKLDERNNYVIENGSTSNFTVNSSIQYHYYRMIITKAARYTGFYYNPGYPTPNYGSGIILRELYYYLNLAETEYPEFKFNTVNYKIKANSIYRYGYNDSNQYLPTNLLDDTNVGYWRSGSNEYTYTSQGRETIVELDVHTKRSINQYTLYGKNNLTYPTRWTLEGFTDPGSNWTLMDTRFLQINEVTTLNNTYNVTTPLDAYKFRFKFYRNNSTYPNFLELQRISVNTQSIVPALRINSNNDINFGGNVIYSGVFSFTGDFTTNGSIYSGMYRKTYTPGIYSVQKPLGGYHTMMVQLWGGGGGGGSGTITANYNVSSTLGGSGGGGGGSGAYVEFSLPRHLLDYSTITLTVGNGGIGATSTILTSWPSPFLRNTYNDGVSGNNGGNTTLSLTMINNYSASWTAGGGTGGGGGVILSDSGATGGTAGAITGSSLTGIGTSYVGYGGGAGGTYSANAGISGNPTNTTTVSLAGSSGGGGSGVDTSETKNSVQGAYGGYSMKPYSYLSGSSTLRSIPDNVSGDNIISYGYNGFNIDNTHAGGSGGAGGYGVIYNSDTTVYLKTAGNGYQGGIPSGGGGGGGSITLCYTNFFGGNFSGDERGGAGGNGGDGLAIITFY